jgi:hypothetical protein
MHPIGYEILACQLIAERLREAEGDRVASAARRPTSWWRSVPLLGSRHRRTVARSLDSRNAACAG